jgi:hypothetical protein
MLLSSIRLLPLLLIFLIKLLAASILIDSLSVLTKELDDTKLNLKAPIVPLSSRMTGKKKSIVTRLDEISKTLDGLSIPSPLIGIVGGYDRESIFDFYDMIMNDLNVPIKERFLISDIYSKVFIIHLSELVNDKEKNLSDLFWGILFGFLFKWILYIREALFGDDESFEEMAKSAKHLIFKAYRMTFERGKDSLHKEFLHNKEFDFSIFGNLMPHEAIDNIETLEYFLDHVIENVSHARITFRKDIYPPVYKTFVNCELLKERHFSGNFNRKPLLWMMMFYFSSFDDYTALKNSFPGKVENLCPNYRLAGDLSRLLQKGNENPRFGGNSFPYIGRISQCYMRRETLEFFIRKNLKFVIERTDSASIIQFTNLIERLGYPKDIMENIVKFE